MQQGVVFVAVPDHSPKERTADNGSQASAKGEDERLIYGVSAMQGWRISMEDSHTTVLDLLAGNPKAAKAHNGKLSFFGVFDGHGGDKVALFAGDNIHNIIAKQDTFKTGNYEQALKDGFLATDRAILNGMVTFSREFVRGWSGSGRHRVPRR